MSQTATDRREEDAAPAGPASGGKLLTILALAQFMIILDVTVVNVALPTIGGALGLGREALTWIVTSYTLALGGLLILGGRLADAFGRRRMLLAGLFVFTVASLVSGVAQHGPELLASRVAQGVGAALLSPAALSIVTTEFTGAARNKALGLWAAIGGAGAALGVLIGGALASGPGWRWVFFINVPVGVVVGVLVPRFVPNRPPTPGRVDYAGAAVGGTAVALLIYGLIRAGDAGWTSGRALVPLALALVAGGAFALVERHAAEPLVPPSLMRRPPLPGGATVMAFATAQLFGAFFINSIYLQDHRHYSGLATGLAFLPVAVAAGFGSHLGGHLAGHVGPKRVALVALVVCAAGSAFAAARVDAPVWTGVMPGFIVVALGAGAAMVTASTSGLTGIPEQSAGVASGVLSTGHELGGTTGIAAISTLAAAAVSGTGSATAVRDAFAHGYTAAAVAAVALALLSALVLPRRLPDDGVPASVPRH